MVDFFDFGGDFGAHGGGGFLDWLFGEAGHGRAARAGGLFDGLGGGLFDGIHGARSGAAFEEFAGLGARARSAGWGFSRFLSEAEALLGHAIDAQLLHDMYKRRNQGNGAGFNPRGVDAAEKAMAAEIREVVSGHGFIAAELGKHPHLSELAGRYHGLGMALPDEDLLTQAHRRLSSLFHPDRNPNGSELMKRLNTARDALMDSTKRSRYERYAQESPDILEKIFTKLRASDFEKAYENLAKKPRLLLTGPAAKPPAEGFGKWVHELSPSAKGGVILGGVLAAGVGIYAAAKWRESITKQQRENAATPFVQNEPMGEHTQKLQNSTQLTSKSVIQGR